MNILKLTAIPSGIRYPGSLPKPMVSFQESTSNPRSIDAQPFSEEHKLTARIEVNFVCNPAQYQDAKRDAYKRLSHALYSDAILELMHIKDYIRAGDSAMALSSIDKLINEMQANHDR